MMSGAQIGQMSRDAARKAAREHRYPIILEAEDLAEVRATLAAGRIPAFSMPFIGEWCPRGYIPVGEPLFVDSSGFGTPGEPALPTSEFVEKLRPGSAYAIIEVGQFQVYVQEYQVRTYPRKKVQS